MLRILGAPNSSRGYRLLLGKMGASLHQTLIIYKQRYHTIEDEYNVTITNLFWVQIQILPYESPIYVIPMNSGIPTRWRSTILSTEEIWVKYPTVNSKDWLREHNPWTQNLQNGTLMNRKQNATRGETYYTNGYPSCHEEGKIEGTLSNSTHHEIEQTLKKTDWLWWSNDQGIYVAMTMCKHLSPSLYQPQWLTQAGSQHNQ